MTRSQIDVGSLRYGVADEDLVRVTDRTMVIASIRVIDDLTGEPITSGLTVEDISVETTPGIVSSGAEWGLSARVADGGLVGLIGRPLQLVDWRYQTYVRPPSSLPDPNAQSLKVGLAIAAPAYHRCRHEWTISGATLDQIRFDDFQPNRAKVRLQPRPIQVSGRVLDALDKPVANAVVQLVDPASFSPIKLVALEPPLYAYRPIGTTVADYVRVSAAGQSQPLARDAQLGARTLVLQHSLSLTTGDVIEVRVNPPPGKSDDPAVVEHMVLASAPRAIGTTGMIEVSLTYGLRWSHRAGSLVRKANVTSIGAIAFDRAAGEGFMCLPAVSQERPRALRLADDSVGAQAEFHRALPFRVTTNEDGQYRMPPFTGLKTVAIEVVNQPNSRIVFDPDFTQPINAIDLLVP